MIPEGVGTIGKALGILGILGGAGGAPWKMHGSNGTPLENIGIRGVEISSGFRGCGNHWKTVRITWYFDGRGWEHHGEYTGTLENH